MNTNSSPQGFVALRRRFEFRSIEVGRWVTPMERDRAATRFEKALDDLKTVLKGLERLVSLRETLGIQYGIGGRPGVSAHYIPAFRQLALAKNAGARMFKGVESSGFASSSWIESLAMKPHSLNNLLANCFKVILLAQS